MSIELAQHRGEVPGLDRAARRAGLVQVQEVGLVISDDHVAAAHVDRGRGVGGAVQVVARGVRGGCGRAVEERGRRRRAARDGPVSVIVAYPTDPAGVTEIVRAAPVPVIAIPAAAATAGFDEVAASWIWSAETVSFATVAVRVGLPASPITPPSDVSLS